METNCKLIRLGHYSQKAFGYGMSAIKTLSDARVVIVQQSLEMGGAERQGLHLARYLKTVGAEVHIWGFGTAGQVADICSKEGIPWRVVPVRWFASKKVLLWDLAKLAIVLRRLRPTVLLPYTMPCNVACGLTWRLTGARWCAWNQRDEGRQSVSSKLERMAIGSVSSIISNSSEGARYLCKQYALDPASIHLVLNGVNMPDADSTRAQWRRKLEVDDACVVTTMVANLHEFKDHVTLIRAWANVQEGLPARDVTSTLVLAGVDGGREKDLKALATNLGICSSVRFIGGVTDVTGLLAASDVGAFSSVREGCPNGVLECMAMSLPVIATDIPGIREALGDENLDCLVEMGSAEQLAGKLSRLIHNPDLRAQIGTRNVRRIHKWFSVEVMCQSMTRLILGT